MEFKGLSIIISASDLFVLIGWGRIGQGRVNELMDALKAVAFPKTGDGTRQGFFFSISVVCCSNHRSRPRDSGALGTK